MNEFALACPDCRAALVPAGAGALRCSAEDTVYHRVDGIWRFLPPARARSFERFIREYETVRRAEGRGDAGPAYFRALPFDDVSGRFREDWRIRARSFRTLERRVLRPLERAARRPLRIADLGAGNGWLSYRLAGRGHDVAAVDLLTSELDGLGAHVWYARDRNGSSAAFTPIQAEFDRLPFTSGHLDLAIFNSSLHYSTDYRATLDEALRALRPDGRLVIMDTPVYSSATSGAEMVREREVRFERTYGFPSNALPSEHFLTPDRLRELAAALGMDWRTITPFYGWRWALRPWKARLRRRREPARFVLIVGTRRAGAPISPLSEPTGIPGDPTGPSGGSEESYGPDPGRPGKSSVAAIFRMPRGVGRHVTGRLWRLWLRARFHAFQSHRHDRLILEHAAGRPILVLPGVFNPKLFGTGAYLAEALGPRLISPDAAVLDMGTGSGIGAIAAARWARRVVAIDRNPAAVRCARINALLNHVDDRVEVRHGNLFEPVAGERFDVVLFNPPFYRGAPRDALDGAFRADDVAERFARDLPHHLERGGTGLMLLSSDGDTEGFLAAIGDHGFAVEAVAESDRISECWTIYRLRVAGSVEPARPGRTRAVASHADPV